MDEWSAYTADLFKRGVMEGGEALEGTETATTIRLKGSEVLVTDGPFAETAEVLGGYYVLKVKDLDEAIGSPRLPRGQERVDRAATHHRDRRGVPAVSQ